MTGRLDAEHDGTEDMTIPRMPAWGLSKSFLRLCPVAAIEYAGYVARYAVATREERHMSTVTAPSEIPCFKHDGGAMPVVGFATFQSEPAVRGNISLRP